MNTQQVLKQFEKFFKEKVQKLIQNFSEDDVIVETSYIREFPEESIGLTILRDFVKKHEDKGLTNILCIQIKHSGDQNDIIIARVDNIARSIVHMEFALGLSDSWISIEREEFSFDNDEVDFLSGRKAGFIGDYILQNCLFNSVFRIVPNLYYVKNYDMIGIEDSLREEFKYSLNGLNEESVEIISIYQDRTNTKPGTRKYRQYLDLWIEGVYGEGMNTFKTKRIRLSIEEDREELKVYLDGGPSCLEGVVEDNIHLTNNLIQSVKDRLGA